MKRLVSPLATKTLCLWPLGSVFFLVPSSLRLMRELTLDSYIIDTLMADLVGDDRQPSAFLVYLHLCSKIGDGASVEVSQRSIAEGTGLSKRAVQTALHHLERRRLISAHRESITAVARYTVHKPWARRVGG